MCMVYVLMYHSVCMCRELVPGEWWGSAVAGSCWINLTTKIKLKRGRGKEKEKDQPIYRENDNKKRDTQRGVRHLSISEFEIHTCNIYLLSTVYRNVFFLMGTAACFF